MDAGIGIFGRLAVQNTLLDMSVHPGTPIRLRFSRSSEFHRMDFSKPPNKSATYHYIALSLKQGLDITTGLPGRLFLLLFAIRKWQFGSKFSSTHTSWARLGGPGRDSVALGVRDLAARLDQGRHIGTIFDR